MTESRHKVKRNIEKRMALYADRLIAGPNFKETDLTIGVEPISVILHSQVVSTDDYNFAKWQIFASAEDKRPANNAKARLVTYDGAGRIVGA